MLLRVAQKNLRSLDWPLVGPQRCCSGAGALGGAFAGTAAINAYKTVTGNKLSQKADDKAMMTSTTLFALGVPAFIIYKTATMTDAERAAHRAQYGQATPR